MRVGYREKGELVEKWMHKKEHITKQGATAIGWR